MTEINLAAQLRERRAGMESFNEALARKIAATGSHLCVGLDPDPDLVTNDLLSGVAAHLASVRLPREDRVVEALGPRTAAKFLLCQSVILATRKFALAYKPNAAFFEGHTEDESLLPAIAEFSATAHPDAVRLCDAKRGDIGNTSRKYADAVFNAWGYDSVTVNPLMGTDCVEPFLRDPAKGVFVLCLTSNPGAADFLLRGDLYLRIAEKAREWNRHGNVGLVVGATRPELAARVREIAPELPFLIPGVGAQGGSLAETIDAISGRTNRRFLINASRAIMFLSSEAITAAESNYGIAVSEVARSLRDQIAAGIGS